MICIVDYGVGNIHAFINIYKSMGIDVHRAQISDDLKGATHIILPGVGHFDHAMQRLNDSGMRPELEAMVLSKGVPVLGVCVGMHMLATSSEEGSLPGLNWVSGYVRAFKRSPLCANLPMPHMGWNDVHFDKGSRLFSAGFDDAALFYFLHSFYFEANEKSNVSATTHYGIDFDVLVSRGNIHGVQFHPEKSHFWGAQLLKNFTEL